MKRWLAILAILLASCAEPIPPDRIGYAGEWQGENVLLVIMPTGELHYRRQEGNTKVSIDAPIKKFEGDDFVVGFGPFTTTFKVSKPPQLVDGKYRMTVDGRELVRVRTFGGTQV